ncbi:stonustoxin subunit alpha-like isoform X2 [Poecilia formosa]|uniref:B30.2/SPRY domain-containing protein n=2 Tax=Poecilia formosa TaxID=48698 RepID=A0A087XKY9_POEFO|nr:PREDICTED: stonustoxin subunit alpha-like isoform X2 [Poecilia formosa]
MSSNQVEIAALGRPFALGMLYDARKDQLITGFSLCNKETIKKNTSTKAQNSSSYHVTASDTLESKSSLLDVNVSLKASILGGLIEVGGSASYLNDKKKFKNQSRITLQYKATTTYEHLSLSHIEKKELDAKSFNPNLSATHVATGILYGANAFFVFDSEKLDSSSLQKIGTSAELAINKIPGFSFEAKVKVELTDEEKAATNKFSCKFYGDLILDKNPATFEDAVKTYSRLPELLGKNGENSVPIKVWLTPLKDLEPSASELMGDFSVGLVRKATDTLESIREMEMRCNEALDEKVVECFPELYKKFKRFHDLCNDYTTMLRQTMQKKIPLIREGKEDEKSVEKLLDDHKKSPFSEEYLDKWLDNGEREINIIKSCADIMEGIKTVPDESDLDREALAAGVENALCFVFTSVETDDPFTEQMTKYLSRDKAAPPPSVTAPTKDHWFFSNEIVTNMRKNAKEFYTIAKYLKSSSKFRFLVAVLPNKKFKGATIYQYMDGILKTEDFSKPVITDVTANLDRRNLLYYYCDLTLDPNTATDSLQLSEGNKKATLTTQIPQDGSVPYVLCTAGLTGRHYFEVTWSSASATYAGVVLACIGGKPGKQTSFEHYHKYYALRCLCGMYMADQSQTMSYNVNPPEGCNRFGVFLDYPGGTVSFFAVWGKILHHLHTFKYNFTEPVYPGLYIIFKDNYAAFCPPE